MKLNRFKLFSLLFVITLMIGACQKANPSILKVYVRSNDNTLVKGSNVRIVGNISKDTPEYFAESKTNESGFTTFDLDELFSKYNKKEDKVAYLTVYARDTTQLYTMDEVRVKAFLTTTKTIRLNK